MPVYQNPAKAFPNSSFGGGQCLLALTYVVGGGLGLRESRTRLLAFEICNRTKIGQELVLLKKLMSNSVLGKEAVTRDSRSRDAYPQHDPQLEPPIAETPVLVREVPTQGKIAHRELLIRMGACLKFLQCRTIADVRRKDCSSGLR